MHSSRMRTGRSLTVFRSLQPGGVYLVRGGVRGPGRVPGLGGCTWSGGVYLVWGVYLVRGGGTWSREGCTWSGTPPPVNRMTNKCKNITLAKTSFRPVIIDILIKFEVFMNSPYEFTDNQNALQLIIVQLD